MDRLNQTKQCKTCPWIKGNDPFNIPNGYSCELHKSLRKTIADKNNPLSSMGNELVNMACHYSKEGEENHCIGWLHNQLTTGNNIGLRIQMRNCENLNEIELIGEQHENFDDTLPKQ